MSKDRGFKKLVGKTIKSVNTKSVNEIVLVDEDGNHYVIKSETGIGAIPVTSLEKVKLVKYKIPERSSRIRAKKIDNQFPFPPEKDPSLD